MAIYSGWIYARTVLIIIFFGGSGNSTIASQAG